MQRWTSICKPHTYTNMHKTIYMQTCTMWWLAHLSSSYSKTFKVISPWKMMGKLWFRCGRALAFCWQSKICGTLVCGSLLHELLFIHWSIYQVLTYKLKWKKKKSVHCRHCLYFSCCIFYLWWVFCTSLCPGEPYCWSLHCSSGFVNSTGTPVHRLKTPLCILSVGKYLCCTIKLASHGQQECTRDLW